MVEEQIQKNLTGFSSMKINYIPTWSTKLKKDLE